jgi:hypothetical protein
MRIAAPSLRGRINEWNDYPNGPRVRLRRRWARKSDHPASFRAHAASIAARATMLRYMTAAFLRTFIADPRAQCTEFEGEMALPGERRGGEAAQGTAIGVEPDALGHRCDTRVCEARRCTAVASGGARIACVDTGLVGFCVHAASPVSDEVTSLPASAAHLIVPATVEVCSTKRGHGTLHRSRHLAGSLHLLP